MGWWKSYDGTVIGDELADMVDDWLGKLVVELVEKYPLITRGQVLHTIAFCSGYLECFDKNREITEADKILATMIVKQRRKWHKKNEVLPDTSKQIAPDTKLQNVYNPFVVNIV